MFCLEMVPRRKNSLDTLLDPVRKGAISPVGMGTPNREKIFERCNRRRKRRGAVLIPELDEGGKRGEEDHKKKEKGRRKKAWSD